MAAAVFDFEIYVEKAGVQVEECPGVLYDDAGKFLGVRRLFFEAKLYISLRMLLFTGLPVSDSKIMYFL